MLKFYFGNVIIFCTTSKLHDKNHLVTYHQRLFLIISHRTAQLDPLSTLKIKELQNHLTFKTMCVFF